MNMQNAVAARLIRLCAEKGLTVNALARTSVISPSTVRKIISGKEKKLRAATLKKLCDGLDMTITEFFDDDIFRKLEQEIK